MWSSPPSFLSYISFFYQPAHYWPDRGRARRKPPLSPLYEGRLRPLKNEVQNDAMTLLQPPPRKTRSVPEEAPLGSIPNVKAPFQSRHHSHMLPCMSYSPHAFGRYEPTAVWRSEQPPFPSGSCRAKDSSDSLTLRHF